MLRRRTMLIVALVLGLLAFVPVTAIARAGDPPCPPGTSPNPIGIACVFVNKNLTGIEAQTTAAATEQAVAAQEASWLGRALELQHRLGDGLPLRDAMWVGTHNSFNTVANTPPSLSNLDSNQHVSLVDQLRLGVRGIEVDVHWFPSLQTAGAKAPVVCHGQPPSNLNLGCTDERLLPAELAPVGAWLRQPEHRSDVVLLYLEDQIDEASGFATAAQAISSTIGDLVYAPPAGGPGCPLLPLDLRRADVLAAGKQVVVMSGCGPDGSTGAWRSTVFDDSVRAEEGNPVFAGYPACTSSSVARAAYGSKLVRFYEDSTFVSATVGLGPGQRLTVDELTAMVQCGVNLFGLDQVSPADPRLAAMVWSWGQSEPATSAPGTCAIDGAFSRYRAAPCDGPPLHYSCIDGNGTWLVSATTGPGSQAAGDAACAATATGARFVVPGSGGHQQSLTNAKVTAGIPDVWVAYRVTNGTWQPTAA